MIALLPLKSPEFTALFLPQGNSTAGLERFRREQAILAASKRSGLARPVGWIVPQATIVS
jgi:hypothetical protein